MIFMKKIFFLFLFLCVINSVYIDNSIIEQFNENKTEKVDVIILFNEEESNLRMSTLDKKGMVISQISQSKNYKEFELINGLASEISADDLVLLQDNSNVKGVYLNYDLHIFLNYSVPLINADEVWNISYNDKNITGKGQTVCVIDTGVDYTHPDLGGCTTPQFLNGTCAKVLGGYDFFNTDSNPMDDNGHGTHCAGIIASTNSVYKGVAPDVRIVAIKVFDFSGYGSWAYVASGIQWCINNKDTYNISVISMSLGDDSVNNNYCNSDYLAPYINSAVSNNITVVVATGNGYDYDGISSPACVQNAIRVTATTKYNLFANYANRGG